MTDNPTPQEYLYALAASPDFAHDGTLFAAKSSGLLRSTDQGESWQPAYASLNLEAALPTTAVAFSPDFADDKTLYAAVEGNVLRSLDAGDTWAYAALDQPAPLVSALAVSLNYVQDQLLLAGTLDDGIIRTTNRGIQWHRWNFGLLDPHIYTVKFLPDNRVLAGTESGIFISTNGGRAWREVDFPMDLAPVISLAIAGETLFAGTEENGLYISKDEGLTWGQLAPEQIEGPVLQIFSDDSGILAVLEDGIYFSGDAGKTWKSRTGLADGSVISSLAAPLGIKPEHPLWVGLSTGEVVKI
jgi:photosystem II stability/assembly factor-like uncharacterized protein